MKHIKSLMPAILLVLASCSGSKTVTSLTETEVAGMVNAKDFAFRAEQMLPSGGRTRILNEAYLFRVTPQEVVSDLPYMGRAYSATIGSSDGGMRFTSKNYTYQQTPGKKNSWNITIYPKDQSDVRECLLTVYSNGTADLLINSNNRQQIRYNGYIQANAKQ
ncbi:MAG: DUF4251 domain-containing protein [Chitinophagaceae bacterium]|jgi:hypothetical protein|nr:DUF4251 domain-containing protein [Chitinophagaceae bacterium]